MSLADEEGEQIGTSVIEERDSSDCPAGQFGHCRAFVSYRICTEMAHFFGAACWPLTGRAVCRLPPQHLAMKNQLFFRLTYAPQ